MPREFFTEDTIAAIATPLGKGAIGVIKISGSEALPILKKLFKPAKSRSEFESHKLYYGYILHPGTNKVIDEVLVAYMKAPKTYTREDVVEIYAHSGILILKKIFEAVLLAGARAAKPGEFTLRAFLNGRIDLSQAEAIEELVSAKTEEALEIALKSLRGALSKKVSELKEGLTECLMQVETAIDFPEEDVEIMDPQGLRQRLKQVLEVLEELIKAHEEGRIYKEGISLVIAGRPNVGKSSLMNTLLREERAIVTPIPGTTRDFLEEEASIEGIPVRLIDTAGLRETQDEVEKIGVERARRKLKEADLVLLLFDCSEPPTREDIRIYEEVKGYPHLTVLNKIDITPNELESWRKFLSDKGEAWVEVSVKEGRNLDSLTKRIVELILGGEKRDVPDVVPSLRQKAHLERASERIRQALEELEKRQPFPELVALEVRGALEELSEILGEVSNEEILDRIFSRFCIGK